ncbi:hypothetical protein, partial [Escherichia coli]|uniref:hypothetical protein n=1 Tax=Escherichia coli TaxID=562 RepID=UPI003C305FF5
PVTGSPKKSMIDVAFLLEVRPVVLRLCLIIRWGVRKAVTTVTNLKLLIFILYINTLQLVR